MQRCYCLLGLLGVDGIDMSPRSPKVKATEGRHPPLLCFRCMGMLETLSWLPGLPEGTQLAHFCGPSSLFRVTNAVGFFTFYDLEPFLALPPWSLSLSQMCMRSTPIFDSFPSLFTDLQYSPVFMPLSHFPPVTPKAWEMSSFPSQHLKPLLPESHPRMI